jgi:hypothetical protein
MRPPEPPPAEYTIELRAGNCAQLAIELVAELIDARATPLRSRVPPPAVVASSVCPSSTIRSLVIDEILA